MGMKIAKTVACCGKHSGLLINNIDIFGYAAAMILNLRRNVAGQAEGD